MAEEKMPVAFVEKVPDQYKIEFRHPKTKVLYTLWANTRYQANVKALELSAALGLGEIDIQHRPWSATEKGMPVKTDAV